MIIALFLAITISPFASPWPDGLEKVAQSKGFMNKEIDKLIIHAPFPDYLWSDLNNERIATALAGAFGTVIVFIFGYVVAALIKLLKNR